MSPDFSVRSNGADHLAGQSVSVQKRVHDRILRRPEAVSTFVVRGEGSAAEVHLCCSPYATVQLQSIVLGVLEALADRRGIVQIAESLHPQS